MKAARALLAVLVTAGACASREQADPPKEHAVAPRSSVGEAQPAVEFEPQAGRPGSLVIAHVAGFDASGRAAVLFSGCPALVLSASAGAVRFLIPRRPEVAPGLAPVVIRLGAVSWVGTFDLGARELAQGPDFDLTIGGETPREIGRFDLAEYDAQFAVGVLANGRVCLLWQLSPLHRSTDEPAKQWVIVKDPERIHVRALTAEGSVESTDRSRSDGGGTFASANVSLATS